MKRLDLKKDLRDLYSPTAREVEMVRVPTFKYLMIDGAGDPNGSVAFQQSVQALYAASYTLKFMIKKEKLVDYPVMALEGHGGRIRWKSSGRNKGPIGSGH